jgi:spore coat protein H
LTRIRFLFCIFSLITAHYESHSQFNIPSYDPVFSQDEIAVVKILIDADSLEMMLLDENLFSDHEYPATFIFQNAFLVDTLENVGFRLRGNTSRLAAKKSFKVSINSLGPRQWQGLEKINLNGNHNDVSLMRAKICSDMYREMGLPAARLSYTKLYINEEYKGIYLNTEHIDEEFVSKYFDQQGDGNLYKCLYPADLNYLGTNPTTYQQEVFGRRPYELKTNLWQDNYSDLAQFITALHNADESGDECEIQEHFDLYSFVKYLALEMLQGHWDAYVYNKNNYYLYHNETTGQICWIPYDMDNTLGIDWVGQDWTQRNIYNFPPSGEDRLLCDVIMENPYWRSQFSQVVQEVLNRFFDGNWLQDKISLYLNLLVNEIPNDPYYPLDYGFTLDNFSNADAVAWGGHVAYGLLDYFEQRRVSALNQLEDFEPTFSAYAITDNGPEPAIPIIQCYYEGDQTPIIRYRLDDGTLLNSNMNDAGIFPDDVAGDRIYHGFIESEGAQKINYQVSVANVAYPCEGERVIWLTPSPIPLQINEVMSLNNSSIADGEGEYDDWIELHNPGPTNVNMNNMFVTDEFGNWNKMALPSVIIQVGTFRLLWADDQPEQGVDHLNFRLSDNGETLWLVRYEQGAPRFVDGLAFPALNGNESFGRITESSNQNVVFTNPTPLAPNGVVSVNETLASTLYVYPNPTSSLVRFSRSVNKVQLYSLEGRLILEEKNQDKLDAQEFPSGMYLLQLDGETFRLSILR